MSQLAKNLRDYVRAQGGEKAAALAIGLDQATVNRIINPDSSKPIRNPSQVTLEKIAKALGSTTHDITSRDLATPSTLSHPGGLDSRKLAVALVAVEKAIRAKGLDPAESWGPLAKLVLWALSLQDELYPEGVLTPADRRGFDAQVQIEMDKGEYDGVRRVGQQAAGSVEGTAKIASARATHRRSRK